MPVIHAQNGFSYMDLGAERQPARAAQADRFIDPRYAPGVRARIASLQGMRARASGARADDLDERIEEAQERLAQMEEMLAAGEGASARQTHFATRSASTPQAVTPQPSAPPAPRVDMVAMARKRHGLQTAEEIAAERARELPLTALMRRMTGQAPPQGGSSPQLRVDIVGNAKRREDERAAPKGPDLTAIMRGQLAAAARDQGPER